MLRVEAISNYRRGANFPGRLTQLLERIFELNRSYLIILAIVFKSWKTLKFPLANTFLPLV